jgi:hypothetical protein
MTTAEYTALWEAYAAKFGEAPDLSWEQGDLDAFAAMVKSAIDSGIPLPNFSIAHGMTEDMEY